MQSETALQGAVASRLNRTIAMFLEAFGLARDPFVDTADPAFYYDTLPGAHARRRLADTLARGRGLAVVVGPIGAGKTSLFNAVQHDMLVSERHAVASILDPTFSDEAELLIAIADAFGFDIDPALPVRAIKDALKRALFDAASRGLQPILFIDEAQLLPATLLEPLRALLNYQLDDRKLLSIAVSGQMEFASVIAAQPNISDRVALWIELGPLSAPEAAGLLHHRLRCAGFAGNQSPFDDEALHELWRHSHGLPRRLTTLAREAMEVAAEYARSRVRSSDVRDALARVAPTGGHDVDAARAAAPDAPRPWWQWWRRAS
ncbi:MAG: AAA family ATPase [Candidatus Eremiobacteraeota bacterium]|nr:AAA family ATPase [Candidatus Eremiobacteraeota bacterium]